MTRQNRPVRLEHGQQNRRIVLRIVAITMGGIPLVAVVWHALNEFLSGCLHQRSFVAGSAAMAALWVLLRVLASQLKRLGGNGL